jgi:holo-[acyl-carrier protein] synthase
MAHSVHEVNMITGIGTDIIEIERIRRAIVNIRRFEARIFTERESEYCRRDRCWAQRFAGRFAAKEAVAKALGVSLSWLDVEILCDENGRPSVTLSKRAAQIAGERSIMVSISHCRAYATACAVCVEQE